MQTYNSCKHTVILSCSLNRLNMSQVNNIQKKLLPLITQGHLQVILDLKNVHHVDCCAVSCFIILSRIANLNHSIFILRNLRGNVKLLANVLKLSQVINIDYHTVPTIITKYS